MFDGSLLNSERQKRRVLELAEAPLIRIGDERNWLGLENLVRRRRIERLDLGFDVWNQHPIICQALVESRVEQLIVRRPVRQIDLAEERSLALEHEPGRVAKRTGRSERGHDFLLAGRTRSWRM